MHVLYLARSVDQQRYAEYILDGCLRFSLLSRFLKRERTEEEAGRGDPDEGSAVIQGDRMSDIVVNKEPFDDIFRRIRFTLTHVINSCYVLCMFAGQTGKTMFPAQRFRKEMGEYTVVIKGVSEFIERINKACADMGYDGRGDLVKYYNKDRDNVGIDRPDSLHDVDVAFYKSERYSYQQEYRVALTRVDGRDHVDLNIGSIRDIAAPVETKNADSILRQNFGEKRG